MLASFYTFELAYAVVWFIMGLNWLYATNDLLLHSSVEHVVSHIWVYIWGGMYVVGGPIGIVGVWRKDARLRVAGVLLIVAALLMNGVAALAASPELRDLTFFIWASAGIARIVDLLRKHRVS